MSEGKKIVKHIICRIKELQKQLEVEKQERKEFGSYEDCGSFYQEQVMKTEVIISELISQKIQIEKLIKREKYAEQIN